MSDTHPGTGQPPAGGFAPLVPELLVTDIAASLHHWCAFFGFSIAYRRPSEGFAYLQRHDGCQIMLCARSGAWESGPLDRPFGRGVLFQLFVDDIAPIAARLAAADQPLHMPEREVWRSYGDRLGGRREIAAADPDGYLILFAQNIGTRPLQP